MGKKVLWLWGMAGKGINPACGAINPASTEQIPAWAGAVAPRSRACGCFRGGRWVCHEGWTILQGSGCAQAWQSITETIAASLCQVPWELCGNPIPGCCGCIPPRDVVLESSWCRTGTACRSFGRMQPWHREGEEMRTRCVTPQQQSPAQRRWL